MDINTFTSKRFLVPGLIIIVLLALLGALPLYAPTTYTIILMACIFMYIILTVSWVMFSAPTGYMSLAPAAFFGVGIYTTAFLGDELPLLIIVVIGGIFSFILALLVGALTLRLKGIYFAIFTFGLVLLIAQLLLFWELHVTGTRGRFVIIIDHTIIYYVMFGILVALMITAYSIRRSKFGLALLSIGENEEAAAHIGINVTLVKIVTFAVSAFFVGAAGVIWATKLYYIDPYIAFNPFFSFMPVLMALFGGMGTFYGPVIGSAIFSYLEEFLITRFPYHYMIIFGVILVVAILYLPNGLVGLIQKMVLRLRKGSTGEKYADT